MREVTTTGNCGQLRKGPRAGLRGDTARIKRLRQRFQEIASIDFFGNPLQKQGGARL